MENSKVAGKSFPDCVSAVMKNLMESSSYSDVTLVCDDYTKIRTHKLILTSSSSLFKDILKDDVSVSEIFLIGIKGSELESLLKFIYLGEVNVHQKNLCTFISTAKNLEFNEIVETVKEVRKEIVETLQKNNTKTNIEKITEVYLKEEEDPYLEFEVYQEVMTEQSSKEKVHWEDEIQPCKEGKFECDECGAVLTSSQGRQKHKKYQHSGNFYPCDQCDYKAKQPAHLRTHKNIIHEGLRPFQCKHCDYKASLKSRLKNHMTGKHDGILQYCSICDYGTSTKHRLKIHVESVHEKLKNQCTYCDYKVSKNRSLGEHIKSVHEGITYPCDQCGYVGKMKRSLKKHVKNMHSMVH